MTTTDAHIEYLEKLLRRPELELLRNRSISVVVTGSSVDRRSDSHSDWDYKIFAGQADIQAFETKHGSRFAISDNDHDPKAFVMIRRFEYLDTEFSLALAATLWIYEHARVLADSGESFGQRIRAYRATFDSTLPHQIDSKYLKLRTRRHGIDSMVRRSDALAVRMLAQDCIKTSLHILHLLHGQPYPYPQWLQRVSRDTYLDQFPEVFRAIDALGMELDPKKIQVQSRELVGNLINVMVTKGFDRSRLEQWWMHI